MNALVKPLVLSMHDEEASAIRELAANDPVLEAASGGVYSGDGKYSCVVVPGTGMGQCGPEQDC